MVAMRTTDVEITVGLRWAVVGVMLVVAGVVLGVVLAVGDTDLLDADTWWNTFVAVFAPLMVPIANVLDLAGGGWFGTYVVPLAAALILVLAGRRWSALYFLAASIGSALLVQVLKSIFGRARPEDILVISDHGSFPSGHTANAATIATVALLLFPRVWVFLLGAVWTFLMAFSRTQVHAHWLSDTVGGALLGIGAALIVGALFVVPILHDRDRSRALASARS
jgi:membrane-associated phospholipid phosphatase